MKGARVCSLSKSELTLHELSFLESQGRRNLWHLPDGTLEASLGLRKSKKEGEIRKLHYYFYTQIELFSTGTSASGGILLSLRK